METKQEIQILQKRIRRAHLVIRWTDILLFVLLCDAGLFGAGILYFLLDYLTHFPMPLRIGFSVVLAVYFWIYLPWKHRYIRFHGEVAAASKFEEMALSSRVDGFHGILVSGVEFGGDHNSSGSAELRNEVVRQAIREEYDPFHLRLIDRRMAGMTLLSLTAVFVFYGAWFAVDSETLGVFFRRALGMNVKYRTKTQIVKIVVPPFCERYKNMSIQVHARGELPPAGRVWIRGSNQQLTELQLDAFAGPDRAGEYECTISEPTETFEYRIQLGDTETDWMSMRVIPPPVLSELSSVLVKPPAYTRRSERKENVGPLEVLEGGLVTFRIRGDRALQSCTIKLSNGKHLAGREKDGEYLFDPIQVGRDSMSYSVELLDQNGIPNRDRVEYALISQLDRAPSVTVELPENGVFLAPVSKLRYRVRVSDDFGIDKLQIKYELKRPNPNLPNQSDGSVQPFIDGVRGGVSSRSPSDMVAAISPQEFVGLKTGVLPLAQGNNETEIFVQGLIEHQQLDMKPGDLLILNFEAIDYKPSASAASPLEVRMVTEDELRTIIKEEELQAHNLLLDLSDDMKRQRSTIEKLSKRRQVQ